MPRVAWHSWQPANDLCKVCWLPRFNRISSHPSLSCAPSLANPVSLMHVSDIMQTALGSTCTASLWADLQVCSPAPVPGASPPQRAARNQCQRACEMSRGALKLQVSQLGHTSHDDGDRKSIVASI